MSPIQKPYCYDLSGSSCGGRILTRVVPVLRRELGANFSTTLWLRVLCNVYSVCIPSLNLLLILFCIALPGTMRLRVLFIA